MFEIVQETEINELVSLASEIWHEYWPGFLTQQQIDYMVEKFQSEHAVKEQIANENYVYYFINFNGDRIGYFGVSNRKEYLFLSKIYIKKEFRNRGFGTKTFDKIKEIALNDKYKSIQLTVNKYNKNSIKAYEKWGFQIINSVVTDIGSGFVMDDYIMEYKFDKKIFSEDVKIRYSEMDFDLVLKPSVLLHFMQDLASDNAEALGFGYSSIIKKNLAWFLLKYRIEFEDYPSGLYDLRIITEPRGYNKIFAFRDFAFYNGQKFLGRAASSWSLVDLENKNVVPVAEALDFNPNMPKFEKREGDLIYGKIKPLECIDKEKLFEIRYDDIDVNNHVNNANYIIWAFEPLDFEFRKTRKIKTLDIVFKKEIKYGYKVLSQVQIKDNMTNHILKNSETDEDLCLINAVWTNK